ncbi:glycosyltransferase involved in cell wall biosynthesis [Planomicrobium koreense]|uniref:Glycosyltransferase involved in cell wall biosynthesis n=1 Tax=Planococcus koreensis TaxID=112331 RepID=A0A7W8FTB6_9BACL|nr:glycosyltransferase family 4 protein [Planococcus koreensis]MBB5179380.1 glycosyltransferase involved in cell wall biosynthesis [Planococcus koreensis]
MKESRPKILQLSAIDVSIETLMVPLIQKSSKEGYIVNCVCRDTGRYEYLNSLGFNMFNLDIPRTVRPVKIAKAIFSIFNHLKKENYDIVHVHTPLASVIARVAAKLAGQKNVIYTAHGYYFHDEMKKLPYAIVYTIEKFSAKFLTDYLLLQSKEDYELSVQKNFKKRNKIIHLSNGVDIWNTFNSKLYSANELLNLKKQTNLESTFVFTFVGRLVKEKGIFELIEAFKRIYEKRSDARLLLIGGFNKSERDIESFNRLQGEIKHPGIIYLGYRKDIAQLMGISDVFILPSHREGLPRSIIEAMALNKAVIASNIRGCREEIIHGENGYLFEKGNSFKLEIIMDKMISNPQATKKMGEKGRAFVEKYFDEEKVLSIQIDLFNKILKEKK